MNWSRWSGAGNSFYVQTVEASAEKLTPAARAQLVQKICGLFPQAPTDGVLFLKPENGNYTWDFFNADGSTAEMCGNAARCAVFYLKEKFKEHSDFHFLTIAGQVDGHWKSKNRAEILMPEMKIKKNNEIGLWVDTGVPHIVLQEKPSKEKALKWRKDPSPAGSNITFIWNIHAGGANAVTFERGVEDFTAACGTGAVAAAAALFLKHGGHKFEVKMPGGTLEVLNVQDGSRPTLAGPAQWDYDIIL